MLFDHCDYVQNGPFSFPKDRKGDAYLCIDGSDRVRLKGSDGISKGIELSGDLILGIDRVWRGYLDDFVKAGYSRGRANGAMEIWDAKTGDPLSTLNGFHYGDVIGAERVDAQRMATWGRDYLVRLWNIKSGDCLKTLPLPLGENEQGEAVLSCRQFSNLTTDERMQYLETADLIAPDVDIIWVAQPHATQAGVHFPAVNTAPINTLKQWTVPPDCAGWHHHILDVHGAEAGYSTAHRLDDGRLCAGGTTYGANGMYYVWDGFTKLQLLLIGHWSYVDLLGETSPNVVEVVHIAGWSNDDKALGDSIHRFNLIP